MRVAVTGATGLIGSHLVTKLKQRGDQVLALSRKPEDASDRLGTEARYWDSLGKETAVDLSGFDAVVHLAGEPVDQRWDPATKALIEGSRIEGTRRIVRAIQASSPRPATLVCASAIGYYGPHGDEKLDETAAIGEGFLAAACGYWENEAEKAGEFGTRVVTVRTGIVLAAAGGALKKMLVPFKLGVGGPIGRGDFYMSWIHIDDVVGIYLAALDNASWSGPFNATAPEPVTNKVFSKTLGRVIHRPAALPVPPLALKLLYGEMSEIVTTGQRVIPHKTSEGHYNFQFQTIEPALEDLLSRPRD